MKECIIPIKRENNTQFNYFVRNKYHIEQLIFIRQTMNFQIKYRSQSSEILIGFLPNVKRICFELNEEVREQLSIVGTDFKDCKMVKGKGSTKRNFGKMKSMFAKHGV